jgi:site-specific recombinase XerD
MLEQIYKSQRKQATLRKLRLYGPVDRYLTHRGSLRYSTGTLSNDAYYLCKFAEFVNGRDVQRTADILKWIEPFVGRYRRTTSRFVVRSVMDSFVAYLREEGSIPERCGRSPAPRFFKHVTAYELYLREQRGLAEKSIAEKKQYCTKFLNAIYERGVRKINRISPASIQDFVMAEGAKYCRVTMVSYCSMLRGFLAFLYASGKTRKDYAGLVITPPSHRHERAPRFLTRDEIESVLESVDRSGAIGQRNFAILLLLATYGLRGVEVARLRLDDIEWRAERIHFRSHKSEQKAIYPLIGSVAEALVTYLKTGRPESAHRELFLTHFAPFRPIQTVTIRHVVKKHLRAVGLSTKGAGAHTLRYSCAQRLFEGDFSIKVVGDYLGHRSLGTTQRYVKIDLVHLREVALNDGEALL